MTAPKPTNLFTRKPARPLVAPSILSADFGDMVGDCRHLLADSPVGAGGDLLHVDVMDGHFVPNLTMGPDMVRGVKRHLPRAFCDVHLMVTDPEMFLEPFAQAGADHCTFHIERAQGPSATRLADRCRALGMTAGICLNPPTPVDEVLRVVEAFDLVLIMSVNPGFSGQKFIPEVLVKAKPIRERLREDQRLEIDGGVNAENAKRVRDAGFDVIVAASAILGKPKQERANAVSELRGS